MADEKRFVLQLLFKGGGSATMLTEMDEETFVKWYSTQKNNNWAEAQKIPLCFSMDIGQPIAPYLVVDELVSFIHCPFIRSTIARPSGAGLMQ